ncbi:MAG: DUF2723 domain-containing protein [Gemmatimonadetes bacterium]|nr:DUF2723 domain-containing protein [Gemmatimonadota bacterium]
MNGIEREKVGPMTLRLWALCTAVMVWVLYVLTLAPTTGFWDTSEYIATAHILGMPHPPGNALFVLVGRVWEMSLAWTGLPIAYRINLLSATLSAGATFFWFLTVARFVSHFRTNRHEVLVATLAAIWIGATAFTVWSQSNLNEKVYTLSLFVVAFVSYLALRWLDAADTPRGDRLLLLIALVLGLGWSNHTMSLLPIPALGMLVLVHNWRTLLRPALIGLGVGLLAVGFSIQLLFVPIRSAQDPIIDEADVECPRLLDAVTPATIENRFGDRKLAVKCEALALSLIRDQYGPGPITERQAPFAAQMANYWQYFDWQWARTLGSGPRLGISMMFLFLALLGVWTHIQGDRKTFAYLGTLFFTVTFLLVYYLNFRYGYSIYLEEAPEPLQHEVREWDYFYIIGFQMWGIYAGLGLVSLWSQLAETFRSRAGAVDQGLRDGLGPSHLKAAPLLSLALVPLFFNYARADRTGDFAARDWAYNILQSVEPYGVLFTNGDNDTFPLWYLQEVEGIRRDVTVIVHSYLGTQWYPKQVRDLTAPCEPGEDPNESPTTIVCQRPFDSENAIGPYQGVDAKPPTRSIIAWTDEEIDAVDPGYLIPNDTTFNITPWVRATVPGGDYVLYPDIMVYHIVREALGDRPVYFAATAPPVYGKWGFQPHLVRHGLAFKLVNGPMEETVDTVDLAADMPPTRSPTWVDRTRTKELLWDVFQVDYLRDWDEWPEPSTESSIPAQYYVAYFMLGLSEQRFENVEEASRAFEWADHFGSLARLFQPGTVSD